MNDPLVVTLLALATAAAGAWLWVRRRWVRQGGGGLLRAPPGPASPSGRADAAAVWSAIDKRLFFLSLAVFAVTRLIGIEDFPIYFFTDEAANTVLAAEFLPNGLPAAVGLTLRDVFHTRLAWLGVLLLVITPAWFLHSRTAFETSLYVSMFAWFVYFYLRYRSGHVSAMFPAVVFGALAFYSYNTGQAGLVLCALLLVVGG